MQSRNIDLVAVGVGSRSRYIFIWFEFIFKNWAPLDKIIRQPILCRDNLVKSVWEGDAEGHIRRGGLMMEYMKQITIDMEKYSYKDLNEFNYKKETCSRADLQQTNPDDWRWSENINYNMDVVLTTGTLK